MAFPCFVCVCGWVRACKRARLGVFVQSCLRVPMLAICCVCPCLPVCVCALTRASILCQCVMDKRVFTTQPKWFPYPLRHSQGGSSREEREQQLCRNMIHSLWCFSNWAPCSARDYLEMILTLIYCLIVQLSALYLWSFNKVCFDTQRGGKIECCDSLCSMTAFSVIIHKQHRWKAKMSSCVSNRTIDRSCTGCCSTYVGS